MTAPRTDVPEPPDGRPTADRDAVQRARNDGGTRTLLACAIWTRDAQPTTGAQTMGFVYEIADRIAEQAVPEIERRAREQEQTRAQKIAAYLEREIAAGNRIAVIEPGGRIFQVEFTPDIARGKS